MMFFPAVTSTLYSAPCVMLTSIFAATSMVLKAPGYLASVISDPLLVKQSSAFSFLQEMSDNAKNKYAIENLMDLLLILKIENFIHQITKLKPTHLLQKA
jgi:hypothetical protein